MISLALVFDGLLIFLVATSALFDAINRFRRVIHVFVREERLVLAWRRTELAQLCALCVFEVFLFSVCMSLWLEQYHAGPETDRLQATGFASLAIGQGLFHGNQVWMNVNDVPNDFALLF